MAEGKDMPTTADRKPAVAEELPIFVLEEIP